MAQNPPWSKDELILALDLYFRADRNQLSKTHPEVINLSELFRELNIPPFRIPSSIAMKLGNFVALDPLNSNTGLNHGRPHQLNRGADYEFWNEFNGNPEYLSRLAETIRTYRKREIHTDRSNSSQVIDLADDQEFPEGKILTREHKIRERNFHAVQKKKRKVFGTSGKLACEVCDFDFAVVYGDIGKNFAECHHRVPLSELKPDTKTKLSDLAIVCANCHRMLHTARPVLTVEELRDLVIEQRSRKAKNGSH